MTVTIPQAGPELQALIDLLRTSLEPAVTVFDGQVDGTPTGQYVVVYPSPATLAAIKLSSDQTDLQHVVRITCCGPSRRDAIAASDATRLTIAGAQLTVPGRSCGRIVQEPLNTPIMRDDTSRPITNLSTFSVFCEYVWESGPA